MSSRPWTSGGVGGTGRMTDGADATDASVTSLGHTSARRSPAALRRRRAVRTARRLLRRGGRIFRRAGRAVTGVVTPLGWATIAVAAATLALGYAAGWRELIVIGLALALLLAVSATHMIGSSSYEVGLDVDRLRTSIGDPATATVRIVAGRRPFWGGRLEVRIGDGAVQLRLPSRTGESGESSFPVPAERRGVVVVGPVRTVRGDPVGLFRRDVEWTTATEVHVHPEIVAVPSTSTGFVRDLEGSPTRELTSSDLSFHALREYQPGDERRHVHWKATARTGELTVRQFEQTRRSHLVVAFGLSPVDYVTEDEFELAVSAAASVVVRAIRDGRDVTVVTSPPFPVPGEDSARLPAFLPTVSSTRFLDAVAGVELGSAAAGVGALSGLAASAVEGISLVVLVVGTAPSVHDLLSWSLRFPLGVQVVVIVCGPAQVPGLRRVAELRVVTIGYLDDLRRSFAGAAT